MCLRTLAKFCAIGLSVFVLAACGGGSSSPSTPETGNTISVFGSDGPMAGADVAVYDLQAYLDDSATAESLLAAPAMTDAATALADDLELKLDAGLGPYMVVVTANATTTDLSTGLAPAISEVKTIVPSLSDARIYATPLTTIAVAIASEGESAADDVIGNLVAAENTAQAFFGFGMDRTIDIFTASPVLDESTTTVEKQQEVAQYRGASEALATLVDDGALDFAAVVADAADGTLEPAVVTAVQSLDVLDVLARVSVASIEDLLDADATGLADYAVDESVDEAPSNVIDSDVDGVNNVDDAFPSDPAETTDTDSDGTGDNADAFPNDPTETTDTDSDGTGDNADAFPNDPAETTDTDSDGTGDNADAFPNDPTETTDTDSDGTGDNADAFPNDPAEDTDSDSDGTGDNADAFPNDPTETTDTDSDGTGDNADAFPNDPAETTDTDSDGTGDNGDNCPTDANADQSDIDTDTIGDVCDPDIDGDSVLNGDDAFPNDPTETTDTDSDGTGDNADAFPNDPAETTDTDSDGTGDNADAFPNDPAETTDTDSDGTGDNADAFPNDPTETTDTDSDGTGDNADAFPNDPAETTDTDSDGTGDNGDNCPTDANADQSDIDTDTIGDVCDPDIDGDGTLNDDDADPTDPNISVDLDSDGIDDSADNCLGLSNADQADIDSDDVGDACDSDKDGDTLVNGVDPDELNSESTYHFDFFYNQLSSDTEAFKAGVVGETVTQADGTVDIGTGVDSTTLDLGSDETGNGSFDVRADYATTEESLSYSGTDFSGATPTLTDATVSTDNLGNTVALSNGVLSFTDETPTVALTAWGQYNYIGSGRVTLNGASTTLATAEEQAFSVLSFADGNSDDADLNADYGVVIMDTVYGDDSESATIEELVNLFTSVGTFNFDGAGALTLSNGSNYLSGLGETDGTAVFSNGLPAPTGTYTVSSSGAVELVIAGESLYGFADSEGDLITLSDPASRTYGVKLGTGVTNASLANAAFDLQGLVIDSSNVTLKASTYLGGVATFSADGTTLTLSGSITNAVAAFSDSALPSVTTASEALNLTSDAITVADNGRLSPITFADSGLELEGFVAANGGLLLRVVDMESVVGGGDSGPGLQSGETFFALADAPFNGVTPQVCDENVAGNGDCTVFRDIAEGEALVTIIESTGQILIGTWTEGGAGSGSTTTPFTSDVRAGSGPTLAPIAAETEVVITQGVLFGAAQ